MGASFAKGKTASGQDARMASVFIARGGSISGVSGVQIVSSGGQRRSAMGGVIVIAAFHISCTSHVSISFDIQFLCISFCEGPHQ
jgi:hypothetical protein